MTSFTSFNTDVSASPFVNFYQEFDFHLIFSLKIRNYIEQKHLFFVKTGLSRDFILSENLNILAGIQFKFSLPLVPFLSKRSFHIIHFKIWH